MFGDVFEENHTFLLLNKPSSLTPVAGAGDIVIGQMQDGVYSEFVPQFDYAIPQRDAAILQIPSLPPQRDAFYSLPDGLLQFLPIAFAQMNQQIVQSVDDRHTESECHMDDAGLPRSD